MELLNTLISRHSVRTYNGEPLLSSDLEKILKSAKAAPVGLGLYDQMHLTVVNPMPVSYTHLDVYKRQPLHGAMLSLSGSMISISFFSDAPFINALIAANVFPFLALPLMITIFMRVSSNFRFVFLFALKMGNSGWNCPLIALVMRFFLACTDFCIN